MNTPLPNDALDVLIATLEHGPIGATALSTIAALRELRATRTELAERTAELARVRAAVTAAIESDRLSWMSDEEFEAAGYVGAEGESKHYLDAMLAQRRFLDAVVHAAAPAVIDRRAPHRSGPCDLCDGAAGAEGDVEKMVCSGVPR